MITVSKCCGCSLRTGCIVFAALVIGGNISMIGLLGALINNPILLPQFAADPAFYYCGLVCNILLILFGALDLAGIIQNNGLFMMIGILGMVVVTSIGVIIWLALYIYCGYWGVNMVFAMIPFQLAGLGGLVYGFICNYSYYKKGH